MNEIELVLSETGPYFTIESLLDLVDLAYNAVEERNREKEWLLEALRSLHNAKNGLIKLKGV